MAGSPENLDISVELALQCLEEGRILHLNPTGFSMHPFVVSGETVAVQKASLRELAPGDIVVIRNGDKFLLHRLLRVNDGFITTKGDFEIAPDEPKSAAFLVGRVAYIKKTMGIIDMREARWRNLSRRVMAFSSGIAGCVLKIPGAGKLGRFFRRGAFAAAAFPFNIALQIVIASFLLARPRADLKEEFPEP